MIDYSALARQWRALGLEEWTAAVETIVRARLSSRHHGDFDAWQTVVDELPAVANHPVALKEALLKLAPWRKGPFDLAGVHIDSEWRSDLKWQRISDAVSPRGKHILDVGSGNGFYALQLMDADAASVTGIDPTLLYVMQFLAVQRFNKTDNVFVLPLRLNELPGDANAFDTSLSMGVLYHQRAPIDHLRELRRTLRANGQLLLETIYLPGTEARACTPTDRYARMKNVWLLPTLAELTTWLKRSGYRNIEIVDTSLTTVDEQRSTDWMPFESLAEALDPADPTRTVEGWPAPHRVVVSATSP